ncbi:MAG: hypothetical protein U1E56_06430 [Bauldia sp.]
MSKALRRLLPIFSAFVCSLLGFAVEAAARDRTAECGPWKFAVDGPLPEEPAPAAFLPCRGENALVVTCLAGDFIASLRYFDGVTEAGYRPLRFDVDGQVYEMWMTLEAIDNALTGHTEFLHPLLQGIRKGQKLTVVDVKRRSTDVLPLRGSGAAFTQLLARCGR